LLEKIIIVGIDTSTSMSMTWDLKHIGEFVLTNALRPPKFNEDKATTVLESSPSSTISLSFTRRKMYLPQLIFNDYFATKCPI